MRKLKDTFKTKDDYILFAEEYICSNLKWIYEKSQDNQLKRAIDECFSENDCYKSLRSPELYDGLISDIPGSWYLYVIDDDVLKRLMRNPLAVHNVKQFCEQNPWYAEFKDKIWNLL